MINKHSLQVPRSGMLQKLMDKLFKSPVVSASILGAMLSAVVIGDGLQPFGIAFFVALAKLNPLVVGAGVLAGHMASGASGALWLLGALVPIYFARIRAPTWGAFSLVLVTIAGQILYRIPFLIARPMLGYDWMLLILEISLAATGVLIFIQASGALRREPAGAEGLEQTLCMVVTCALALTSIAAVNLGPFNILTVMSIWLVLITALAAGSGAGACAGVVVGVLAGYSHTHPAVAVASLAMAGLLAGLFNNWGRIGVFGGFAAGVVAMAIYGGYPTMVIGVADLAVGGLIFAFTPAVVRDKARRVLLNDNNEWVWEYQQRLRQSTVKKLQNLSMVFSRLSDSFVYTGGVEDMAGNHLQMSRVFDHLACDVCTGCVNYKRCWEKDLYSNYSQLLDYLTVAAENPDAKFEGLLSRRCHNLDELTTRARTLYAQFVHEQRWTARVQECKDVVSQQLLGVSDVISQLTRQIRLDVNCRKDLEDDLAGRLMEWGIDVDGLSVSGTERNLPCVKFQGRLPAGENHLPSIQAMVSEVVGQPLQIVENITSGETTSLVMAMPVKYKLELGVAQSAKGDVNGDAFSHLQTSAGRHVYMLSDGMGKGKKARAESNQALFLARDMLEAGFSAETAIKALNSLLVLRQGNERFATLDMAVIDTSRGKMDIFKTGAATSFVKNGDDVQAITGAGLPIGIVPGVEPRLVNRNIAAGDYLVMVSDGVLDGKDRDESWLANQLRTMGSPNSAAMARQLLNRAAKVGSRLHDDATVLVVRIKEARNEFYWEAV